MNALAEHGDALVRRRTWFGLTAVMEIRNRSWHRAGVGRVLIAHPPAVNWLLRFGLNNDSYRQLSILHEFGHFQVLPFIALYSIGIGAWIFLAHKTSFIGILAILVGIHATWEMLAELSVRFSIGPRYSIYYKGISMLPRAIFWSVMAGISLGGWIMAWV